MKYLLIIIMLTCKYSFSQTDDEVINNILNLNLETFNSNAKTLLKKRYEYTKENENFLIGKLNIDQNLLVTKFDFDSISIKTIPVFKFNLSEGSKNYLSCIDITLNDTLQEYVLFSGNQIIYDGYYSTLNKQSNDFEKLNFCLIGDNYYSPYRYGSKLGFLYKEFPVKKYFVFKLDGLVNYIFIIKNNLVYAVFIDKNEKIKIIEFNKFFCNYFKKMCK
ncbi:hypothetical protein M9Q43_00160 [Flavobacterium sp. HXWNR29]|uniref:hypothetical protein n=1 Tax=Flavobacterium odoriferum TaxID=2946604 RepID=UPI0021CB2047|nr:hypothetical protein [Flavobacterium sp. HXWNR29]MCU4187573.1 hypothetical protein [Flavobacterium sp. HXWNR29]